MAITLRHDAAAVVPPSNNATRKYGQSLVMQQNQQKYASQQAGYDRLLTLGRDQQQRNFQVARDNMQQVAQMGRDFQQRDFQMARDKQLFEQQQQMQEAQRQQRFMEEARQQSGRFIMDSIDNGEYDPQTARELRQNLIDEAEVLGNPALDATQRAEALQALRGRRSVLSANRQPKAPPPTAQEQFDQSVVIDPNTGMRYRRNSKGDYEPLEQPKQPPATAAEAFSDPKVRDKYMADAIAIETKGGEVPLDRDSRKRAAELARELWEQDNLPTTAPELPNGAAPAAPGTERSILEPEAPTGAPPLPGAAPATPGTERSILETEQPPEMPGYMLITPEDGSRPYYYKTDSAQQSTEDFQQPPAPAQNPWTEAAGGEPPADEMTSDYQAAMGQLQDNGIAPPGQAPTPADPPQAAVPVSPPDFTSLAASAPNDTERLFFNRMQTVYQQQTPDVQAAISVLLNAGSSDKDAAQALEYLQSKGIDLNELAKQSSVKEATRETMEEKYGENYNSF